MNDSYRLRIWSSWLTLILATGLLYFRVNLHSDSLFLEDLADDLFVYGGAWKDWRLSPAPAYVPDMLLYFLGYAILPSAALHIFFVTACQAFMLVMLALWLARKIRPQLSVNARALIILLVAFSSLVASRSGMWLFFNTTNNHLPALLFSLLSLGLILDFLEHPKLITALSIIAAGVLAKVSTAIFFICFALPVFVACVLAISVIYNQIGTSHIKNRLFALMAVIIGSQYLAAIIDKILTYHDPLAGRAPASAESAGNSLKLFLQATQGAFALDNLSTFVFSLVVASAFAFLVYRLIQRVKLCADGEPMKSQGLQISFPMITMKESDWRFSACIFLLIITIPINISGAILSGGFADTAGYRYFMFPIALGLLLTIISIDKGKTGESGWKDSYIYLIILILLIGCFSTLTKSDELFKTAQNREILQTYKYPNYEDKIAACLKEIEEEGISLDAGMSDYWLARGVAQLLPNKNPIVAVTNDLTPFFWMSTIGPMIRAENYPKRYYNFAILRNPKHGFVFDFTPQTVGALLPVEPSIRFCKGTDVQVWHYQNSQLDSVVKAAQSQFLYREKLSKKTIFLANKLPSLVGSIRNTDRTALATSDAAGFLAFGPYIDLQGGDSYKVSLKYTAKSNGNEVVGVFEIGRFDVPEKTIVLHRENLKPSESNLVEAIVKIPTEGLQQVEFRTWFTGQGVLTIESVELEKLESQE